METKTFFRFGMALVFLLAYGFKLSARYKISSCKLITAIQKQPKSEKHNDGHTATTYTTASQLFLKNMKLQFIDINFLSAKEADVKLKK